MTDYLPIGVDVGREVLPGQRMASIEIGGVSVFTAVVYDNDVVPASRNILLLFADRLRRVLEDD